MNKLTLLFSSVALAGALAAQGDKPAPKPASQPTKQEAAFGGEKLSDKTYTHFGDGAHTGKALTVAEVMKDLKAHDGKPIRLAAPIQSVCQKKGCWMYIGEGKETVMVRFKDYGFFVPKDAAGQETVIEGVLAVKVQSVDEQRHYLEDAGKPEEAKKITEPKTIVGFMAAGVAIKNAAKPEVKQDAKVEAAEGKK